MYMVWSNYTADLSLSYQQFYVIPQIHKDYPVHLANLYSQEGPHRKNISICGQLHQPLSPKNLTHQTPHT